MFSTFFIAIEHTDTSLVHNKSFYILFPFYVAYFFSYVYIITIAFYARVGQERVSYYPVYGGNIKYRLAQPTYNNT